MMNVVMFEREGVWCAGGWRLGEDRRGGVGAGVG